MWYTTICLHNVIHSSTHPMLLKCRKESRHYKMLVLPLSKGMHFLDGCTEGLSDFRTEMSIWYSLTSIPILVSSVSLSLSNFWVSWSSNYTFNSEKEPPTQSIPIFTLNSLSCKVKSKEGNGMSWCEKLCRNTQATGIIRVMLQIQLGVIMLIS